ncbi:MAG: manganese efflux pump [Deltaproteobacteria bacterium]|nr:manganese efflux pump [Deltaproteobacteria bacterium]
MDAFAVSVAGALFLERLRARHVFRFAFHFGLFQGLMPILGWLSGRSISAWVMAWGHVLAFVLLSGVGLKAVISGLRQDGEVFRSDPTRGWSLVLLSLATSLDAFAVGVSVAWIDTNIWRLALTVAVITAALSALGMGIGHKVGAVFGQRVAVFGGLLLIGLGVKILVEHLTS